ncbi:MAG: AIR synthase-related protein [Promethearchaeota archaeon]
MERGTPKFGKVSGEFLQSEVLTRLGAGNGRVVVPPGLGLDYGAVELDGGEVLVVSTDPFYVAEQFGIELGTWFGLQIVVADVLVSGIRPQYLSVSLQFPPTVTDETIARIWGAIHEGCEELGIAVVAGHTGRYEGCDFPTVGAATVFGSGPRGSLVSAADVGPGDAILVTTGLGVEAALSLEARATGLVDPDFVKSLSVVPDVEGVLQFGGKEAGVTSMHDVAEGGVLGAVFELARGRVFSAAVDARGVLNPEPYASILERHDLDPWSCSSQGSLLVTCREASAESLCEFLLGKNVYCARVGQVLGTPGTGRPTVKFTDEHGERVLDNPPRDEFWDAFSSLSPSSLRGSPRRG